METAGDLLSLHIAGAGRDNKDYSLFLAMSMGLAIILQVGEPLGRSGAHFAGRALNAVVACEAPPWLSPSLERPTHFPIRRSEAGVAAAAVQTYINYFDNHNAPAQRRQPVDIFESSRQGLVEDSQELLPQLQQFARLS